MKTKKFRFFAGIIGVAILFTLTQLAIAAEVPRMTIEELKAKIGYSDHNIVIVDVRKGKDWTGSEFKIKGAVRENPAKLSPWAEKYPKDKTLVLYCA
jgi:hypothetical protein